VLISVFLPYTSSIPGAVWDEIVLLKSCLNSPSNCTSNTACANRNIIPNEFGPVFSDPTNYFVLSGQLNIVGHVNRAVWEAPLTGTGLVSKHARQLMAGTGFTAQRALALDRLIKLATLSSRPGDEYLNDLSLKSLARYAIKYSLFDAIQRSPSPVLAQFLTQKNVDGTAALWCEILTEWQKAVDVIEQEMGPEQSTSHSEPWVMDMFARVLELDQKPLSIHLAVQDIDIQLGCTDVSDALLKLYMNVIRERAADADQSKDKSNREKSSTILDNANEFVKWSNQRMAMFFESLKYGALNMDAIVKGGLRSPDNDSEDVLGKVRLSDVCLGVNIPSMGVSLPSLFVLKNQQYTLPGCKLLTRLLPDTNELELLVIIDDSSAVLSKDRATASHYPYYFTVGRVSLDLFGSSPHAYSVPSLPPRAANSHSASVGRSLPAQRA